MQDLGHGCIFLVQKAGALQVCPTDSYTKRELIECARAVTEKVRSSPGARHSHSTPHGHSVAHRDQRRTWEAKPETIQSGLVVFSLTQGFPRDGAYRVWGDS